MATPPKTSTGMPSRTPHQLSGYQRRHLRKLANPMKPIVYIGEAGVTDGVMKALDQALLDHELVKLRLRDKEDRKTVAQEIADKCGAELCGVVGRSVILFRPRAEDSQIELPTRNDEPAS